MKQKHAGLSEKYLQLSELSSKFNLSFSSHLVLGKRIIALDGVKKKLLVAEKNQASRSFIVDLDQVKTISIKKIYSSIKPGDLNKKGLRQFLRGIYLVFEYRNEDRTDVLPFYECDTDRLEDLPSLERNARNWQMILTRMVKTQNDITVKKQRQLQLAD